MIVPNEVINVRLNALTRIKAVRHPRSGRGIGQDTSLKFRIIDRQLRQGLKDFADEHNELIERHGVLKNKDVPGSYHVPKDCPGWSAFQKDARKLREAGVEIADSLLIKLSELQFRDEDDEWEKMDEGAIGDLGELLVEPEEKPAAEEKPEAAKPTRPKREKKPRPE